MKISRPLIQREGLIFKHSFHIIQAEFPISFIIVFFLFFVSNRSISLLLLYFLWSSNFPLYLGVGCFFFFKRDAFLMKIDFFILYILANFTFFLDVVIFESTNEFSRWIFHILCFFFIGFFKSNEWIVKWSK